MLPFESKQKCSHQVVKYRELKKLIYEKNFELEDMFHKNSTNVKIVLFFCMTLSR